MKIYLFPLVIFLISLLAGCSQNPWIYSEFVGEGEDQIEVVVVRGTPYEMGFSLGNHLKDQARESLTQYLKAAFQEDSILLGTANLKRTWEANLPYMDYRFLEEMKGFSEGSGINIELLQQSHAVPLVAPYSCSGVSAWGKATASKDLYQIRNLDYSTDAGMQKYPLVVVYKPEEGIAHANITFLGMLSCHSGMNAQSVVLGEKGESPLRECPYDLNGKHFTILFRELLYDAKNLSDVERTIENSPLVKRYYLFFGDGKRIDDAAVKYLISTPDSIKWHKWADNDDSDVNVPAIFDDVTYYTMKNDLAAQFIRENYGHLDGAKMVELSRLVAAKENLVDIIYNASKLEIWVSNATTNESASARQFVHVDLKKYFNE